MKWILQTLSTIKLLHEIIKNDLNKETKIKTNKNQIKDENENNNENEKILILNNF